MAASHMSSWSFNPQSIWSQGMYHSSMGLSAAMDIHSASPDRRNEGHFIIIVKRMIVLRQGAIHDHLDNLDKFKCLLVFRPAPGQPYW